MKDWHKPKPDLGRKQPYHLPGCDTRDVAGDCITVNALLPGYPNTDRMAELGIDDATIGQKIPVGRLANPAEFAALAAFLASGRASYITGQATAVDGGHWHAI